MKILAQPLDKTPNLFWQLHEKISSFTAHLIGPVVFDFGLNEEAWNLSTQDLLKFEEGSVGKVLGEFLHKYRLEPIAGAESHDLYHILFDYPTTFKGEVALQFFLQGNGQTSLASLSTSIGAWFILPTEWKYLKACYKRGKSCRDISKLNMKTILNKNFENLKTSLLLDQHQN